MDKIINSISKLVILLVDRVSLTGVNADKWRGAIMDSLGGFVICRTPSAIGQPITSSIKPASSTGNSGLCRRSELFKSIQT